MLKHCLFLLILTFGAIYGAKGQNCAVNAGVDQTICIGTPLTLSATSGLNFLNPPNVKWSQLSGPNSAIITTPFSKITTVTDLMPGVYFFKFIGKCIDGIFASDIVKVTILAIPPAAQAGDDISVCNLSALPLNAIPVLAPAEGTWTTTGTGTFSDIHNPNSTYKPTAQGVYTLTWTVSNGICSSSDVVQVNVSNVPGINAGVDQTIQCAGACATLNGSSPGVYPQSGVWSQVSGPSTLQFTNISNPKTKVCGLVPGTYILQWNVSGPCSTGSDQMIITVSNINAPPAMGANKTYLDFCFNSGASSVIVSGTALLAGETGLWTLQSGPSTVTFSSPTAAVTTVNNVNVRGTYIFRWTKTTALGCTAFHTHTIRVESDIPALLEVPDTLLTCSLTNITLSTPFSELFGSPNSDGVSRVSSVISKPTGSAVTIANGGLLTQWNITKLDLPGKYTFRLGYSNSCNYVVQDIVVNVSAASGQINAGSDIYLPCGNTTANPQGQVSNGSTFINTWLQISGPNKATLSNINSLSLMQMTNLIPGVYVMRLTSVSGSKCGGGSDDMKVIVVNSPPSGVNAGADATVCYGNYPLIGNVPKVTESGAWTVSPTGPLFLPDNTNPNAIVTDLQPNTVYTFTWKVTNACGVASDEVVITTTNSQGPNVPDAGLDQCLNYTTSFPLSGNIPNSGTQPSWTALTAGSSISPINTQNTTTTITGGAGTYKFLYTLSTSGCTSLSDTVIVTIKPASFTINAGIDQNLCVGSLPASVTLTGSSIPTGFTGLWTPAGGPTAPNIMSPTGSTTVINELYSGTYQFLYEISGGVCTNLSDMIAVNISKAPSVANAGTNQSICSVTTSTVVTLTGNQPATGETSYWSLAAAPRDAPLPSFTNFNQPSATVTNLVQGTYVFRYNIQSGIACPESWDTMTVYVVAKASAGTAQTLCSATEMVLYGNTNTSGIWSFVSSMPSGLPTPTIDVVGLRAGTARVTGLQVPSASGTATNRYTFRYTIAASGSCAATTSDVVITNVHEPTQANAGPDQVLCFNQNSITLVSQAPTPIYGTGSWRQSSGPSNPIKSGTYPSVTYTDLVPGIYIFSDSIINTSSCPISKDQVSVLKEVQANAGADTSLCAVAGLNFGLHANYPSVGTGTWIQISGPSTLSFTNPNNPYTQVGNWVYGNYQLKWKIVTVGCVAVNEDVMELTVSQPITGLDAGLDQAFCAGSIEAFQVGSAPQTGISYSWTPSGLLSNSSISNPNFIGVNSAGTYNYLLIASRGACTAYDALTIKVNPKPLANIKWNGNGCSPVTFTATDNDVIGSTYNWTFGPDATPAVATGAGPHAIVYSSSGTKNAKVVVTTPDGCIDSAKVQSNGDCFTLPVKLVSFVANWKEDASYLFWEIASPINFSHFVIQRSYDGKQFDDLDNVMWSLTNDTYHYTDYKVDPFQVIAFYRLRLVDVNDNFEYSQIRTVKIETAKNTIKVVPNPFRNKFDILNTTDYRGVTQLELMDVNGRLLLSKSVNYLDSRYEWSNLDFLNEGVYFVRVAQGNNVQLQKIIKLN